MKPPRNFLNLGLALLLTITSVVLTNAQSTVTKDPFGKTAVGEKVDIYTLRNANGIEAQITNYGGIVVSLKVPDRHQRFDDVVLGFGEWPEQKP
jgi:aldose 1-epimerase